MFRPVWIEVNLKSLRKNFRAIKRFVGPKIKIIATVKQSAYGHGLIPVARELSCMGVDFFGVGSLEEAIALREEGFREPILILTAVLSKFADYFVRYNIRPTIVDGTFAKALHKEARRRNRIIPAHIKIDTGMGRLGFYYKEAHQFINEVKRYSNIRLEGICTHFPAADTDPEFTDYQINIFNQFIAKLKKRGVVFPYQHCANSIGVINYPHSHFNMVRPGLILYGVRPSPHLHLEGEPILSLKSKIVFLKRIKKGMSVSYGRNYIAQRPTLIGTVSIGYADGYPWALSNRGKAIVKDKFFSLAGRVCMDHLMLDLRNRRDISIGEEVILIGRGGSLQVSAEDLAQWAGTIPYEIVSRLSYKIPRIYKYPSPLRVASRE